jgi:hypothetical protein
MHGRDALDMSTGVREEILITAARPRFLFVPAPVAHAAAQDNCSSLLVTADSPNTSGDEFPVLVLE